MDGTQTSKQDIRHQESDDGGTFYVERDGRRAAHLRYTRSAAQTVVLEHTEVSPALQGGGVGRLLVEAAVEWARRTHTKIAPACPYAKTVFDRHPELRDVLR